MQIRINLLPQEYRKKERTPLRTFLPMLGCVTVGVAAAAFWAWLHFGQFAEVESEHASLEETWAQRKQPLAYLAALKAEEADYRDRQKTIAEIATSRVPWTRKLDQLCRVVTDDHGGDRYLVWVSQLEVKAPDARALGAKDKKAVDGEKLTVEGLCFSGVNDDADPLQRYNNFHEAITQSDFYREDFVFIGNPAGKAVTMDDELKPARAWTVDLPLMMRSRQPGPKGTDRAEGAKDKPTK